MARHSSAVKCSSCVQATFSLRCRSARGRSQLLDRAGLLPVVAVVGAEHFEERPLRPFVVARIAGADFAVPVEREADFVQLLAVAGDVLLGGDGRMLARLDGVLFGRKAEGVVAIGCSTLKPFWRL